MMQEQEAYGENDDTHFCLKCRKCFIGLDTYIHHRRHSECSSLRVHVEVDTPTAADALASEAAFMESIGLYLNVKPSPVQLAPRFQNAAGLDMVSPKKCEAVKESNVPEWDDALLSLNWSTLDSPLAVVNTAHLDCDEAQRCKQPSLLSSRSSKGGKQADPCVAPKSLPDFVISSHLSDGEGQAGAGSTFVTTSSLSGGPRWKLWQPECGDLFSEVLPAEADQDLYAEPPLLPIIEPEDTSLAPDKQLSEPSGLGVPDRDRQRRCQRSPWRLSTCDAVEDDDEEAVIKCLACRARVNRTQFSKHLISHYHYHKSRHHISQHTGLVLSYIEDIVKEAPFQCQVCSFYCNWPDQLEAHWRSSHLNPADDEHFLRMYWCAICQFYCRNSSAMLIHLQSQDHVDMCLVINRFVPITIRRCRLEQCGLCPKKFRLRFSLRAHARREHGAHHFVLPDHPVLQCQLQCSFRTLSHRSLHSHHAAAHPEARSLPKPIQASKRQPPVVNCFYCSAREPDVCRLKDHIWLKHPQEICQCSMCGHGFALGQELAVHMRSRCRTPGRPVPHDPDGMQRCKESGCDFSGLNAEMLLLHQSIKHHTTPDASASALRCAICRKSTKTRSKMLEHIRTHLLRHQSHRCAECHKLFRSRTALTTHFSRAHSSAKGVKKKIKPQSSFACSYESCDFVTSKKSALTSHLQVHCSQKMLKCRICGDAFRCKRQSELNRHLRLKHGSESGCPSFRCALCVYSTQFKQHLSRHTQVMHSRNRDSGGTFYFCPYCSFRSSAVDNLRKHILRTNKHPGAKVYRCHSCQLATNNCEEYKRHLMLAHADSFATRNDLKTHLDAYFRRSPSTLKT